jgi:glycosyltransferase involved in cell wall biosynthesis
MKTHHNRHKSVAFFPPVSYLSGNPYWPMLASALKKSGINFLFDTPIIFKLGWLIRNRDRVDILHIHYIHPFYGTGKRGRTRLMNVIRFALNMLWAQFLGYRIVFTLHNLKPTKELQPAWVDRLGHYIAVFLSDRIIVHCEEARRLLYEHYGRRRKVYKVDHPSFIDWYPNSISKKTARDQLSLPQETIIFSFFGEVRPNKGIELLIQAFHKIKQENIAVMIAGAIGTPESYANSLQDLAKNDPRIFFFLRKIPDEEVQVFMNASDIIVLPFSQILTSSSAHLAMSFKRPVITPIMGCLPELIEPNMGWLYNPNDSDSLASTMQSAANSDFHTLGQNAYRKVAQYSCEKFAQQTIEAYWDRY